MEANMKTLTSALLLGTLMASGPAIAAQNSAQPSDQTTAVPRSNPSSQTLTQLPTSGLQVSDFYKQSVYDPKDNKIGDVKDLILEKDGRVNAAIIGVGGFLGAGEKDVAVPFDQLQLKDKNGKRYLVMNANKDALNSAPGLTFDRSKQQWIPENKNRG
jgi:sporulation protein YlmC with PRC-barrel domain